MPKFGDSPVIPIAALFDLSGTRPNPDSNIVQALQRADIIVGVDVMTGQECLVFDADFLREIRDSGEAKQGVILKIGIDQETEELEQLLGVVIACKGEDDEPPQEWWTPS